jgi:hypothetical protein
MSYNTIHNDGTITEQGIDMVNQCLWISIRDYLRHCHNIEYTIIEIKEMAGLGAESDYEMADWENPVFRHAIERIADVLNIRLEFYPVYLNEHYDYRNIEAARHIINPSAREIVSIAFYGAHFELIISGPNIRPCRIISTTQKPNIGEFKPNLKVINPHLEHSIKDDHTMIKKNITDNNNKIDILKKRIDDNIAMKEKMKLSARQIVNSVEKLQYQDLEEEIKDSILQDYSAEFNKLLSERKKIDLLNISLQSEIDKLIATNEELFNYHNQSNARKILVYCHPKKINYSDKSSHWWLSSSYDTLQSKPAINYILERNNIKPESTTFRTVDITGKPDYQTDGFSSEFITEHKNEFDIVMLPDCGGRWWEISKSGDDIDQSILLYSLIESLMNIVKPGGKLYLSKITIHFKNCLY